jgi:hypothetical protein
MSAYETLLETILVIARKETRCLRLIIIQGGK